MTPETKLKYRIDSYLMSQLPEVCFFVIAAGPYQARGLPERIICVNGRFLALEIKAPKGKKARPLQEYHLQRVRLAGGIAEVVRSVEEVKGLIECLKTNSPA